MEELLAIVAAQVLVLLLERLVAYVRGLLVPAPVSI